jgi:hypothetical protein
MRINWKSMRGFGIAFIGLLLGLLSATAWANTPVSGAAFTTVNENYDGTGHCKNGNPNVNCNIYDGKEFVWLNGGPTVAYVGPGTYFFAVLEPGGQADPNDGAAKNLSDLPNGDAYTNRIFSVDAAGNVTYGGSHIFDSNKIRLVPYDDTSNPGGVYIMAICSLADGYPVDPSDCKYDAFKIQTGDQNEPKPLPLSVTKDATGSYDQEFTWTITKSVDQTLVKQLNGNVTFTYTVKVTHDAGAIGHVKVGGNITIFNPNVDASSNTVPVDITSITDQLSNGTVCTVLPSAGAQTLSTFATDFTYTCDLGGLPAGDITNTVTVSWPDQALIIGALAAGSADFTIPVPVPFNKTENDECVNVSDSYAGALGTVCVGDANPKSFTYQRTVPVPPHDCVSYDNTATFTANDTGATGSAGQTVTVCRKPVQTGALTMGFWQNKNGQAVITGGSSTAGVCNSGTYLRTYAPFQDLSATATCAQVGTYVTNVIKAANASGASMNAMLKAQMLATALDVFFSDPANGNKINAPAPIGAVLIDLTVICKDIAACTIYENTSAAFGGALSMTVSQLLAYAASQSNAGGSVWYGQVKATQELAKDTFDAINNQKAFTP